MNIDFKSDTPKEKVFEEVSKYLQSIDFQYVTTDASRPWGGFYVIDEAQGARFSEFFFPEVDQQSIVNGRKLSPKILIVAPNKRLSWQYHHRRAEIWKVIGGAAGIATSETDDQGEPREIRLNQIIKLKQGERHRLIGRKEWGIVAEIWQHTDPLYPSNEEDIVRVQDDFGR